MESLVAQLPAPARGLPDGAGRQSSTVRSRRSGRCCSRGDTLIDGGNSHYHDDIARAAVARAAGIHYVDMGTSGGVWGLERGYCLMIGGERDVVTRLDPLFRALAPARADATPRRRHGAPRGTCTAARAAPGISSR